LLGYLISERGVEANLEKNQSHKVNEGSQNIEGSVEASRQVGFAEQIHIKVRRARSSIFQGAEGLRYFPMGPRTTAGLRKLEVVH
jgi:hypothetical protein